MEKTIASPHGVLIAERLVAVRKRAKLTQRELAVLLVRPNSFVANNELGQRRVDLAEFYWICKACKADPSVEVADLIKAFNKIR